MCVPWIAHSDFHKCVSVLGPTGFVQDGKAHCHSPNCSNMQSTKCGINPQRDVFLLTNYSHLLVFLFLWSSKVFDCGAPYESWRCSRLNVQPRFAHSDCNKCCYVLGPTRFERWEGTLPFAITTWYHEICIKSRRDVQNTTTSSLKRSGNSPSKVILMK